MMSTYSLNESIFTHIHVFGVGFAYTINNFYGQEMLQFAIVTSSSCQHSPFDTQSSLYFVINHTKFYVCTFIIFRKV